VLRAFEAAISAVRSLQKKEIDNIITESGYLKRIYKLQHQLHYFSAFPGEEIKHHMPCDSVTTILQSILLDLITVAHFLDQRIIMGINLELSTKSLLKQYEIQKH